MLLFGRTSVCLISNTCSGGTVNSIEALYSQRPRKPCSILLIQPKGPVRVSRESHFAVAEPRRKSPVTIPLFSPVCEQPMTRFRSSKRETQTYPDSFGTMSLSDEPDDDLEQAKTKSNTSNPFEMRRRRRLKKQKDAVQKDGSKKKEKKKKLVDEDVDPYDSDPGESYRDHCLRIKGLNTKTCLAVPSFLKNSDLEGDTVMTEPPSPLSSELDDVLNQTPRSLPSTHVVRYSLRTSIGDGSAKQPTGPSVFERRELRPNNVQVNVSHWSDTGARPYMEDRYSIEDLGAVQVEVSPVAMRNSSAESGVEVMHTKAKNKRIKMPVTFFGCYDGHGGDKASQYCADWMSSYVKNEDSFPHDLGYAMKNAFTTIDDDFVGTGYPDGSTACAVSMVGGRRIVCANAGDSRAIVVRKDGSVVRLSRDHKPGMPDETRRISELGGRVVYWGRWRVEGLLAVSRSVGDASLKPYITAEPEVCEYDVGKDDWFLVMSSDGVWDVLDNEEVAHVIIATACVMKEGKLVIDTDRFKYAARNLCEHAKSCGSTDNFSAIVVDLQSCGNPNALSGCYEPRRR